MTWPILLGAARVLAQSRVIAVVGGDRGRLAESVLRIEHRDVEGGWQTLFGSAPLPDRPRKLLAGASHVISLVATDAWADRVAEVAPDAAKVRLTPPPAELVDRHAMEHLIEQLSDHPPLQAGAAGIVDSIAKTGLASKLHDASGPALLHVGSGSAKKNWPLSNWLELAGRLKQQGRRVRFVLGEAELEALSSQDRQALEAAGDVQVPKDLSELWFLLRGIGLYVGHDTGPTHLAAVAGLRTIALYGPHSKPAAWRPIGPRVELLTTPDLDDLAVDEVMQRVG